MTSTVAHICQNRGLVLDSSEYIYQSINLFNQIKSTYELNAQENLELTSYEFDLYERKRKQHLIEGDLNEAVRASQYAINICEKENSSYKRGISYIGEGELFVLHDLDKAKNIWESCLIYMKRNNDNHRNELYLKLALTQIELLQRPSETRVKELLTDLDNIDHTCNELGLFGPLPKIPILKGLAYLVLGDDEKCFEENLLSFQRSEFIGYDMYRWFSLNNCVVSLHNASQNVINEKSIPMINRSIEVAESSGFLNFVSSDKATFFQYAFIKNVIKLLSDNPGFLRKRQLFIKSLNNHGFKGVDKLESISACAEEYNFNDYYYLTFI